MKIYIDNIETEVRPDETILEACERIGIHIPSMCFAPGKRHIASCMVCMVRNEQRDQMLPSCSTYPTEGMRIDTSSEEVQQTRRLSIELLLSDHRADCEAPCTMVCPRKLDVGEMLYLFDKGDYPRAKALVAAAFPLPEIGCKDCKAPCEKACRRGTVDVHVPIREIVEKLSAMDIPSEASPKLLSKVDRTKFFSRLGTFSQEEKIRLRQEVDSPSTCLHCACLGREDCRLREIATSFGIRSPRFPVDSRLPFKKAARIVEGLVFDPAKCIRCGICVYNTKDAFTFSGRGFSMQVVLPKESYSHVSEDVAALCPTGALRLEH